MSQARCLNYKMSKRTFRSKAEARKEAIRLQSTGPNTKGSSWVRGTRLYPFKCRHGDHWHLSSQKPREARNDR